MNMKKATTETDISIETALYFAHMFSKGIDINALNSEEQAELLSVRSKLAEFEIPNNVPSGDELSKALMLLYEAGSDEVKRIMLNQLRTRATLEIRSGGG